MPTIMRLNVDLSPDRESAILTMFQGETPLAHMIVDATMLEDIIRGLAACRAQMAEQVPRELDPGTRLDTLYDPVWNAEVPANAPPGVGLVLRHPGLGRLSFLLPFHEARNLGRTLLALGTEAPP